MADPNTSPNADLLDLNPPGMTADEAAGKGSSDAKVDIPDAERTDDPSLLPKPDVSMAMDTLAEGRVQDSEFEISDTESVGETEAERDAGQVTALQSQVSETNQLDQGFVVQSGPTQTRGPSFGSRGSGGVVGNPEAELVAAEAVTQPVTAEQPLPVAPPVVPVVPIPVVVPVVAKPVINTAPVLTVTLTNNFTEDAAGNAVGSIVATYTTSDAQGNTVTVTLSDTTNYSLDGSGNVRLTAAGLALVNIGSDLPAFTLTPNDGTINGSPVTVDPSVTGTNDAPVATFVTDQSATEDGATITGQLTATDSDTASGSLIYSLVGNPIPGLVINANGSWSFNPSNSAYQSINAGETRDITVTYQVSDGTSSDTESFIIRITGSEDVSTLTSETKNLTETNAVLSTSGTLTVTDLDATDATVVAQTGTAGTYGTFVIGTDGAWTYTTSDAVNQLNANQVVTETFNVSTTDGGTATVTINITGTNDGPTIVGDLNATMAYGGEYTLTTADLNYSDPDDGPSGVTYTATLPSRITMFVNNSASTTFTAQQLQDGLVRLVHAGQGPGTQSLVIGFSIEDGNEDNSSPITANFSLSVVGNVDTTPPDAPTISVVAGDDIVNASESSNLVVSGTGEAGATVTLSPTNQTTVVDSNGNWSITVSDAATSFGQGSEVLTVTQTDAAGNTSTATQKTITVDTLIPSAPIISDVAGNNVLNAAEAQNLVISGTGEVGATVTLAVTNQAAVVDSSGNWSITVSNAASSFGQGPETLSVTQTDAAGNISVAGTREITIDTALPDAPTISVVAGDDVVNASESSNLVISGTGEVGATVTLSPTNQTAVVDSNGNWSITVSDAATTFGQGSEVLTVTQTDAAGNTSAATQKTITVDTFIPSAPTISLVAGDDFVNSSEVQNLVISGTGEIGATVTLAVTNQTALVDSSGNWSITVSNAASSFGPGAETLSVTQTDAAGNTSPAGTRDITIDSVTFIAPTTNDVSVTGTEDSVGISVLLTGADADGDVDRYVIRSLPVNGTLKNGATVLQVGDVVSAPGGSVTLTFVPDANWFGDTSFTFAAKDVDGVEDATPATASITVTSVNDDFTDANEVVSYAEDSGVQTGTLLSGTTSPDGPVTVKSFTIAGQSGPFTLGSAYTISGQGVITINADGSYSFTPAANWNGSFPVVTYTLTDGSGADDTSTLTIGVTSVNDAPVVTGPVTLAAIAEDSGVRTITSAQLLANASDLEGNSLSVTNLQISSGNGTLTDNGNGTWSYRPARDDDTSVNFTYTITDNGTTNGTADPRSVTGTATMDITPVMDDATRLITVTTASGGGGRPTVTISNINFPAGSSIVSVELYSSAGVLRFTDSSSPYRQRLSNSSHVGDSYVIVNARETAGGPILKFKSDIFTITNANVTNNNVGINSENAAQAPVALDLDGDGVEYLSLSDGVRHDYDGDGFAEATAWVDKDDGLLAKLQEDGTYKIVFSTEDGETDLEGLAKVYDSNKDGVLDSDDTEFSKFGVWQDKDSDGFMDDDEFQFLDQAQIQSLSLVSNGVVSLAANGDVIVYGESFYTKTDGSVFLADDAGFITMAEIPTASWVEIVESGDVVGVEEDAGTAAQDGSTAVSSDEIDLGPETDRNHLP